MVDVLGVNKREAGEARAHVVAELWHAVQQRFDGHGRPVVREIRDRDANDGGEDVRAEAHGLVARLRAPVVPASPPAPSANEPTKRACIGDAPDAHGALHARCLDYAREIAYDLLEAGPDARLDVAPALALAEAAQVEDDEAVGGREFGNLVFPGRPEGGPAVDEEQGGRGGGVYVAVGERERLWFGIVGRGGEGGGKKRAVGEVGWIGTRVECAGEQRENVKDECEGDERRRDMVYCMATMVAVNWATWEV